MTALVTIAGERLQLLPQRALLWPARALLMVADAHFGKAARFRTLGVPVPSGTTAANLQVLDGLIARHAVERIVFLGDLMHGRLLPGSATFHALIGWRGSGKDLRIGRFRPTFGGERTRSSSTLLFPERGLINTLMPPRVTGVQATLGDSKRALVLGAFRTALGADAQTVDTDGDLTLAPAPTQEALLRVQGALGTLDGGRGTLWHL
jgi:hypothetical protein